MASQLVWELCREYTRTLTYSCQLTVGTTLPFRGPGMVQRIANFSPGGLTELSAGNCSLNLCSVGDTVSEDLEDMATNP